MKISEITVEHVVSFLRLEPDAYDAVFLQAVMEAAKAFISGYVNIPVEKLDDYPDFFLAFMVLCQDMHDNRSLYVENDKVNRVVQAILSLHDHNLVPEVEA